MIVAYYSQSKNIALTFDSLSKVWRCHCGGHPPVKISPMVAVWKLQRRLLNKGTVFDWSVHVISSVEQRIAAERADYCTWGP